MRPAAAAGSQPNWDALNQAASNAKAKFDDWARKQRLNDRVSSSMDAAARAAQLAAAEAQRTARKVDAEYEVKKKAAEAARTVNEAAEELDSKFQFRSRTRNAFTDAKRMAPRVMRQIGDFFSTPMGAVTFMFLFLVSVFTGAFWVILRFLLSFMWLGILLGPMLINYLNARAMAEQKEQYREYMREQQARQQNPLYGTPFEDMFSGFGGKGSKGGNPSASRRSRGRTAMDSQDVIDVSFEHIDD